MKTCYLAQKGMMTLTLLIMLSSALFLLLLLDDDSLRLHSVLATLRQQYVESSQSLQLQSREQIRQNCRHLPLRESGNAQLVTVEMSDRSGELQQFFYCERHALFRQLPKSKSYERQFDIYLDREKIPQFAPHLTLPQNGKQSASTRLYWFGEPNAEWEIEGDVNGVIISEGSLSVSGKGKIKGTIISGGTLSLDGVALAYNKSAVTEIVTRFSEWRLAEKSWHDFKSF